MPDTSGKHAFFNDDRSQFVDLWLNNDGNITIKASNGRPWRPMWVVVHAEFYGPNKLLLTRKDYHVYCQSPFPGGGGEENWFRFKGPDIGGAEIISLSTEKEAPWKDVRGGWEIVISVSGNKPRSWWPF
jgi:hypothetical protein